MPASRFGGAALLTWLLLPLLLAGGGCRSATAPEGSIYASRFESVWRRFDETYPYFEYKQIDWDAAHAQYAPRAETATSQQELVAVLVDMLAPLRDLHVNLLRPGGSQVPTYRPDVARNWDRDTWLSYIGTIPWHQTSGSTWGWGRYGDIGYLMIGDWNGAHVQASAVNVALDSLRGTRAIIIDVRPNPGGNSSIAYDVAARFSATAWIGTYVQYRNGPRHGDLGPLMTEPISPRGSWQYLKPVFLLVGRGDVSSSEHFISAMRELPNVRVLGDTTVGATANPALYDLGDGWQYTVSRWIGYTADKQVIEWKGIAPDEVVPWSADDFARLYDPVLERALEEAGGAPVKAARVGVVAER